MVFGTQGRRRIIGATWRNRLHEYLGAVVRGVGADPLGVNGIDDHVHLLVRIKPIQRIDFLIRDLKANSSGWIHREGLSTLFAWQRGYAAFSVSESNAEAVCRYIDSQEEHHRRQTFEDEFRRLLKLNNVSYDE